MWLGLSMMLGLLMLAVGLYRLQLIRGDEYAAKSVANFIKDVRIQADRGMIKDARGEILVENRPSFDLFITPAFCQNCATEVLPKLAAWLHWDETQRAAVENTLKQARRSAPFRPVQVQIDLTREEHDVINARELRAARRRAAAGAPPPVPAARRGRAPPRERPERRGRARAARHRALARARVHERDHPGRARAAQREGRVLRPRRLRRPPRHRAALRDPAPRRRRRPQGGGEREGQGGEGSALAPRRRRRRPAEAGQQRHPLDRHAAAARGRAGVPRERRRGRRDRREDRVHQGDRLAARTTTRTCSPAGSARSRWRRSRGIRSSR